MMDPTQSRPDLVALPVVLHWLREVGSIEENGEQSILMDAFLALAVAVPELELLRFAAHYVDPDGDECMVDLHCLRHQQQLFVGTENTTAEEMRAALMEMLPPAAGVKVHWRGTEEGVPVDKQFLESRVDDEVFFHRCVDLLSKRRAAFIEASLLDTTTTPAPSASSKPRF